MRQITLSGTPVVSQEEEGGYRNYVGQEYFS